MATFCTPENGKKDMLTETLNGLSKTVDWSKHRMYLIDNSPGDLGLKGYQASDMNGKLTYIYNDGENLGTAEAINIGWRKRQPKEHAVKMDDDCLIHDEGWLDLLEECIERDPMIGIIGLKRKDLDERPDHESEFYRSSLRMLRGERGERWLIVEDVKHVMGTCQLYNHRLLAKIGYLYQPRKYGFDDSLAAVRCEVAGFKNCFLPHINIDHIDPGDTEYQTWKHKVSSEDMVEFNRLKAAYRNGREDIYYQPF